MVALSHDVCTSKLILFSQHFISIVLISFFVKTVYFTSLIIDYDTLQMVNNVDVVSDCLMINGFIL